MPFRARLPMIHRDGWTGPRASNPTAFAWFVFDRDHSGPAIVRRLDVPKIVTTNSKREAA
jgi:hypothetical protein